jgi:hypothetical protein
MQDFRVVKVRALIPRFGKYVMYQITEVTVYNTRLTHCSTCQKQVEDDCHVLGCWFIGRVVWLELLWFAGWPG